MVSQNVWVCISVVVFFAGFGIGYTVLQNTSILMPQNMQTMHQWMQNSQFRNQMMQYLTQNPQQMNQWMIQDPTHIEQMSKDMNENHEFMTKMMSAIINDPQLRLQMLGHMTENQEVMQQMRELMQTGNMTSGPMMGQYP